MMARTFFSRRSFAVMAATALPFVTAAGFVMSIHAGTNTRLQDIADDAALAGVNSLAANIDQPAEMRLAEAMAAAGTVLATQPGIVQRLSPSVEGLSMSVAVEDSSKGMRASATARYVPAKDRRSVPQVVHLRGYAAAAL